MHLFELFPEIGEVRHRCVVKSAPPDFLGEFPDAFRLYSRICFEIVDEFGDGPAAGAYEKMNAVLQKNKAGDFDVAVFYVKRYGFTDFIIDEIIYKHVFFSISGKSEKNVIFRVEVC